MYKFYGSSVREYNFFAMIFLIENERFQLKRLLSFHCVWTHYFTDLSAADL